MTQAQKAQSEIRYYNLGYIGHNAIQLQDLFSEFTMKENDFGYFLLFENYSDLVINQGVKCITNCFESEEHFRETLFNKLLFNYLELA